MKIGEVVANHSVKCAGLEFKKMPLTQAVKRAIEALNASRGGKLPYSWEHISEGYTGGFYQYEDGKTPVMKSEQVKDYLAMAYCLYSQNAA